MNVFLPVSKALPNKCYIYRQCTYIVYVIGDSMYLTEWIFVVESNVFHRPVYPMLPGSLNCPYLIGPLVFSNVYLHCNNLNEGSVIVSMVVFLFSFDVR
jgi:hypothetical protein